MRVKKLECAVILLLGGLLGFGVASWRNVLPGQAGVAQAQGIDKEKPAGGIFSPPGTSAPITRMNIPSRGPFAA